MAEVIYAGIFTSPITKVEHMVKIYDPLSPPVVTPTELALETPGYTLSYDAGITDVVTGGIIKSEVSIYVRNIGNVLDDFLDDLRTSGENRYLVEILREGYVFWRGVLLQDFSEVDDKVYSTIRLSATDGIGLLDSIKVDRGDLNVNAKNSLLAYVMKGLMLIPTAGNLFIDNGLWAEFDIFVKIKTDWFTDVMESGKEPLSLVSVSDESPQAPLSSPFIWTVKKARVGYNGVDIIESESVSYKELIEHILTRFNAVLIMDRGIWYITQRELLETADMIQYHGFYRSLGPPFPQYAGLQTGERTHKEILTTENVYRNNGKFNFLPGIKTAKVTFIPDMAGSHGLLSSDYVINDPNITYTTGVCEMGVGNYLHIGIMVDEIFNCFTNIGTGDFQGYWQYILVVQCGSHYLQQDGKSWAVGYTSIQLPTFTPLYRRTTNISPLKQEFNYTQSVIYNVKTNDIPETASINFTLLRGNFIPQVPFWLQNTNTILPTYLGPIYEDANYIDGENYLYFIFNNEDIKTTITFEVTNPASPAQYSVEHEMEDSLFGSAAPVVTGQMDIWDGSDWVKSVGNGRLWNKGYSAPRTMFFNELLISEILRNQSAPLLMFCGNIDDRDNVLLFGCQAIELTYKGAIYRMFLNKVDYDPYNERWGGDWVEISREDIDISVTQLIKKPLNSELIQASWPASDMKQQAQQVASLANLHSWIKVNSGDAIFNSLKVLDANGYPTNLYPYGKSIRFGFLYNWYAVTDVREITSEAAWRVPSQTDFEDLVDYLGGSDVAGGKLKSTSAMYWDSPNTGATDEVNFGAIGGGYRTSYDGLFKNIKLYVYCWSTTETIGGGGYVLLLEYNSTNSNTTGSSNKKTGYSIRLVRDASVAEQAYPDGTRLHDYAGNDGRLYQTTKIGTQVWTRENLVETKYRNGDVIPNVQLAGDWIALSTGAYCYYDNDINNAWGNAPIAEVSVSPSSFRGAGTIDDPLDLADKADDALYSVRNGEFVQFNDTVDVILEWENWESTLEQTILVAGLKATGIIMVAPDPTGNHTDNWAKFGIKAINGVDGEVTFICTDWPDEDINVIILILKFE